MGSEPSIRLAPRLENDLSLIVWNSTTSIDAGAWPDPVSAKAEQRTVQGTDTPFQSLGLGSTLMTGFDGSLPATGGAVAFSTVVLGTDSRQIPAPPALRREILEMGHEFEGSIAPGILWTMEFIKL